MFSQYKKINALLIATITVTLYKSKIDNTLR